MNLQKPKQSKSNTTCPVCEIEIVLGTGTYFMLACDRPYCNIYIHKDCRDKVTDDLIRDFIVKNYLK